MELKLLQKSDERGISVCYCSEMVRKAIWKTARILFAEREKRRKYSAKDYAIPASGKVMQGFQKWPRCICPNSYKCKSGVSK